MNRVEIINSGINTAEIFVQRRAARKDDAGETIHLNPGQRGAVDMQAHDRIEIGELLADKPAQSG